MANALQGYFPQIRTRQEVLEYIFHKRELRRRFQTLTDPQKKEFLDLCTGEKGVNVLSDPIVKEILNPEIHKERLEDFLSAVLERRVTIAQILPNDSVRLTDEVSLIITDIVVCLEDGSLANIEIQKIGYAFPGQRVACYSADLLLRQYKRAKNKRKKERERFTYRDVKKVYTIVLFEKSTREFHQIKDRYLHRSSQKFDTGLKLEMLQENILIALDIFREVTQNKRIETPLEAWLTFLGCYEPERILKLLEYEPEFEELYREVYDLCRNIEGVMKMFFSKELLELDRNTVKYMVEELEEQVEEGKKKLEELKRKQKEEQRKLETEQRKLEAEQRKLETEQRKLQAETEKRRKAEQYSAEQAERIAALEKLLQEHGISSQDLP